MDGVIDSHCHLDAPELEADLQQVLGLAMSAGVTGALIPGYGPQRWQRQSDLLASGGPFLTWGAFGLHPWAVETITGGLAGCRAALEEGYRQHACGWGEKLKAVGEFGLDRSRRGAAVPLDLQRALFSWHLDLAERLRLPVVLHLVRSDGGALDLLEGRGGQVPGVVHAFSSHPDTLPRYAALGLSFSYGAALLWSAKARASLLATPPDRMLFETDAPQGRHFAAPCGPHHLIEIVEAASQVLGKSVEYCLARHRENCQRVFGLP